ncbi:hypothetical protein ACFL2T_05510 [Elusimicrobiota bacterium]
MGTESDNPEAIIDNLANLDTARMTLRWALERIRTLERNGAESQELLQQHYDARQKAIEEFGAYRKSVEGRTKKLQEKERFVSQMQTILNDLFKGEVDVADFVKRREELEASKAALEAKVRKRLQDAEEAHRHEVEENAKRLSEMEGTYSGALRDAQQRYHAEIERLQRENEEALRAEKARLDKFREESHRTTERSADQYHQKMLVLEHSYSAKRQQLEEDLQRLKQRLLEEDRAKESRRVEDNQRLQERWDEERQSLEARLAERERHMHLQEEALKKLEADFYAKDATDQKAFSEKLDELSAEHAEECDRLKQDTAMVHAELRQRERAFDEERRKLLEEQGSLREEMAKKFEGTIRSLQESFRDADDARLRDTARQIASLRQHYEQAAETQIAEIAKLRGELREQQDSFQEERTALLAAQTALRQQDAEKFAEALRSVEVRYQEKSTEQREQDEADIEALRKHYDDVFARQQRGFRTQIDTQAKEVEELRGQLRQQRQELEGELSNKWKEAEAERSEILKRESETREQEAERFRRALREQVEAARAREILHSQRVDQLGQRMREREEAFEAEHAQLTARHMEAARAAGELHSREAEELRARIKQLQTAFDAERAKLSAEHAEAERATGELHAREAEELRARIKQLQTAFDAERAELVRQDRERLRQTEQASEKERGEILARHEEAVLARDEAIRASKGAEAHASEVESLREKLRRLQDAHDTERAAMIDGQQRLREDDLRKREETLMTLERFFMDRHNERTKQTSEQIEELRRYYHKAMIALREEKEQLSTRGANPAGAPPARPRTAAASTGLRAPTLPLPAHLEPRRRWPWVVGALALLVAAIPWFSSLIGRDHPVSFSHPTALVWRDGELWAADWKEQAVYRLSRGLTGLKEDGRFPVPQSHIMGMALDGEDFYLADSWKKQIELWRLKDGLFLLKRAWPSPGESPSSLYFDGKHLWSADKTERRIYRHELDDELTVLQSFPVEHSPVGMFSDDEQFWSADSEARLVYRHRWDRLLSLVASYRLGEFSDGKTPLSSFTMRGGQVWVGRDGLNRILERPLWRFKREAAGKTN